MNNAQTLHTFNGGQSWLSCLLTATTTLKDGDAMVFISTNDVCFTYTDIKSITY